MVAPSPELSWQVAKLAPANPYAGVAEPERGESAPLRGVRRGVGGGGPGRGETRHSREGAQQCEDEREQASA